MNRMIIISNRLGVTVKRQRGKFIFQPSAGGLATGLESYLKSGKTKSISWIGWPGLIVTNPTQQKEIARKLKTQQNYPVYLSRKEFNEYYLGFCNDTLWPLFHYFIQYTIFKKAFWTMYQTVNERFFQTFQEVYQPGDTIWIHDYQLMLLPQMIRKKYPNATIGFFLHIPFPSYEVFRLLPWRTELLNGVLGADLIGFHTYDYERHFLSSVYRLLGYEHTLGQVFVQDRLVRVDTVPMGINTALYAKSKQDSKVITQAKLLREEFGNQKLILSLGRLDYTKGLLHRLKAFRLFLKKYPAYKGKITLALNVVPSRVDVERYQKLKHQIDETVGNINSTYGHFGWFPIRYMYKYLPLEQLRALYNIADIALITPLRDGMNLMAKEFVATKNGGEGVLILSELAGAAKELGEAILVNPNNFDQVADAILQALETPPKTQIKRNKIMQRRLQRYDVNRWVDDFLDLLNQAKQGQDTLNATRLTQKIRDQMIHEYQQANRRLILLDYDGTLVPFYQDPDEAIPDQSLLKLLQQLSAIPNNEIVIVSGRGYSTLETWFKGIKIGIIADHGIWIKEKEGPSEMIEPLIQDWKEDILPVLHSFEDRIPGALVEEKEFSLVWHYRKADPDQGALAARELKHTLMRLADNFQLEVQEGHKIVEIKKAGVNKGRAILRWVEKEKWDFIIAFGDDRTDEDTFANLPEEAYSVKIGLETTKARFRTDNPDTVRALLRAFLKSKKK